MVHVTHLDDDGGGRPGADQNALGYIIDVNAHRDALRQPHPPNGRVGSGQQFRPGRIVAISNAAADALDMAAQRGGRRS